jgi:hypothetical protein
MNEARRALKRAIADRLDASEAEQRRMARILNQVAAAIRESARRATARQMSSPDEPKQD